MPNPSLHEVLTQLQPLFHEALNDKRLTITRSSSALNTPNWDSLAYIELIQMMEAHFNVRFALGELHEMKDVGDMVDLILEKSKAT